MKVGLFSCATGTVKYLLFLFNFIFAVSGLCVLITGIAVLADISDFNHFLEGKVIAPPIVLIIAGLLIFFIASLGCYGALKENTNMLLLYALCLLVIFIFELAVGIAAITFKSNLHEAIEGSLQRSIERRSKEDMMAWDPLQKRLTCCGVQGVRDWYTTNNSTIPTSCCRPEAIDQSGDCKNSAALYNDRYYSDGCVSKLKQRVVENANILIGVGIGICFLQVLGMFLACWLAAAYRREKE